MKRVAVATSLLDAVPASYAKGELALISSDGSIVKTGAAGPYSRSTMIGVFVGLTDGTHKRVGTINPFDFKVEKLDYAAAVGKTIRVGYDGSANKLVCIDPTLTANIGKFGTLRLTHMDITKNTLPGWGDVFEQDVQIATGETNTTLYAKLQAAGTSLAAKINAKYGAGTVAFTSGAPVLNAASSYLQFVFAAGKLFTVTLDDIFDGTAVKVTAGDTGPFVSGLTGAEVIEMEKKNAILDGYNPNQNSKYQSFNLDNYIGAAGGTNYDALLITTKLPKEYESPDAPTGWDVQFVVYAATGNPSVVDTLKTLLDEVKVASDGYLTQAVADTLYAPHA